MSAKNFTTSFVVEQSPQEVFEAIKNIRGWWSRNVQGETQNFGDIFTYEVEGVHRTRMQLVEVVPNKKLVWHVLDNWLVFVEDKTEWIDNNLVFTIDHRDGKTAVTFTQIGLTEDDECFDVCNGAWAGYINGSLRQLIATGTGNPNQEREEDLAPLRALA